MKHIILFCLIILLPTLNTFSQNATGNYIQVNFLKVPTEKINKYVNEKFNKWQKKGNYEKLADYQKRVNEKNRTKKLNETIHEAANIYAKDPFQKAINHSHFQYDTESEVFKITFTTFNDIYVKVPISEAKLFDNNFKRLQYKNTKFSIEDDKFLITETDIFNPVNSKTYHYNILAPVTFKSIIVEKTWEPWSINNWTKKYGTQINEGTITVKIGNSDVDVNIPKTDIVNNNIYALVIGNEDYSSFQTGLNTEANVEFAKNDARIFSKYLNKTIGIPEKNIDLKLNATYGQIKQALTRLATISELKEGNIELIFYYAGHGLPNENTKEPYIIPVDISGTDINSAIKLDDIYKQLTEFNPKKITVFLDACFSGGARNQGLLASRGVKIRPKTDYLSGNIVVFSSSSDIESSGSYKEKQHGMFTYFLLKKLQETNGDVNYKELADYLKEKITLESVLENNKKQTPQVLFSTDVTIDWGKWKLK